MKEVVIISYIDPKNVRGLQTVALNYAKLIRELGLNVSIFSKGNKIETFYVDRIKINTYKFKKGMNKVKECLNARKAWKTHYDNVSISVVNSHDYMIYIYIYTLLNKNVKKIFTVHDPFLYHQRMIGKIPMNKKNIKYYVANLAEKIIDKTSDITYVISKYTNDRMLVKRNINNINRKLVYDWINMDKFIISKEDKKHIKENLNFDKEDYIVFTLRGLEKRMGIDLLIQGFDEFNKINPHSKLIIGGRGPEENNLHKMVKDIGNNNIIFLGYVPDEKVINYYQAADVFVMPSLDGEGFGLPLLEAMACGTLVLGSNRCAIPEVLKGKKELLIDPVDKNGIYKALEFVYSHRNDYNKQELRKYVINNFSKNNIKNIFKKDFLE